jgi:hypothetical protein
MKSWFVENCSLFHFSGEVLTDNFPTQLVAKVIMSNQVRKEHVG